MTAIPETVKRHFAPWMNINCWVAETEDKRPACIHDGEYRIPKDEKEITPKPYKVGQWLRWEVEPQDNITTMDVLDTALQTHKELQGFGIIVRPSIQLAYYDFDDSLKDGIVKNPDLLDFLEVLNSYTEVSTSKRGLHTVVGTKLPDNKKLHEYAFKESFSLGKFYCNRNLKLTGDIYGGFDVPIRILDYDEFTHIEDVISVSSVPKFKWVSSPSSIPRQSGSNTDINWGDVLSEVGILHTKTEYMGSKREYPDNTSRYVVESYRIPCPNRHNHTDYDKRKGDTGPDAAILTKFDDGTCAVKCNHTHCAPEKHPNLLKKLWEEIFELRDREAQEIVKNLLGNGVLE